MNFKVKGLRKKHNLRAVTFSTPIAFRTKCKYCLTPPKFYYLLREMPHFYDVHDAIAQHNFHKSFLSDFRGGWAKYSTLRNFDITEVSFPNMNSYSPILHMARGHKVRFDVSRVLVCECTRTHWLISNNTNEDMQCAEVLHRKSNRLFPIIFEYW